MKVCALTSSEHNLRLVYGDLLVVVPLPGTDINLPLAAVVLGWESAGETSVKGSLHEPFGLFLTGMRELVYGFIFPLFDSSV